MPDLERTRGGSQALSLPQGEFSVAHEGAVVGFVIWPRRPESSALWKVALGMFGKSKSLVRSVSSVCFPWHWLGPQISIILLFLWAYVSWPC